MNMNNISTSQPLYLDGQPGSDNTVRKQPKSVKVSSVSYKYKTFSCPYPLDFSNPIENLYGAYRAVANEDSNKLEFVKLEQVVPANTGLFLKLTPNTTIEIPVANQGTVINGENVLIPCVMDGNLPVSKQGRNVYGFGHRASDPNQPMWAKLNKSMAGKAGISYIITPVTLSAVLWP